MPIFELENLCVRYNGTEALRDVTFTIHRGEKVAVVGESGAGKSTLLRILYEQRRAEAAFLPQDMGLVKPLSVFHNIYMGRLHAHPTWYNLFNLIRPMRKDVDEIRAIVRRLGIEEKLFSPVEELSGGQQLRTAVGRALHKSETILLGDEPVSAVDEHQARDVLGYIHDTHETVLIALHDRELAINFSDRIIGLRNGVLVMDQPSAGMIPSDLDHIYLN